MIRAYGPKAAKSDVYAMITRGFAAAARAKGARAVALSIVYPTDDPQLVNEIKRLGEQLGEGVPLIVGGASANAYRETLDEIGARITADLPALREELRKLRAEHVQV